jgi:hypothetical protein
MAGFQLRPMPLHFKRCVRFSFLTMMLCFLCGCGNSNLASVTGQVTLDGKAVPKAFIKFLPTGSTGAPSFGKTDEAGNYRMMFSDTESGAWIGENRVIINTGDVGLAPGMGTAETIPSNYNVNSTLVETVKGGSNKIDFKLTSDAGKVIQSVDPDAAPVRKK